MNSRVGNDLVVILFINYRPVVEDLKTMHPHAKGILLTTDIPTKQLIDHLDKLNNGRIIVKDSSGRKLDLVRKLMNVKYKYILFFNFGFCRMITMSLYMETMWNT